jgi:hypothetical protein
VWQRHVVISSIRFIFHRKGLEPFVVVLDIETLDPFYVSLMLKYCVLFLRGVPFNIRRILYAECVSEHSTRHTEPIINPV